MATPIEIEAAFDATEGKIDRLTISVMLEAADRARWHPIATRPESDDLMWFAKWDGNNWNIDGPREAAYDDFDLYDYWAECGSPILPSPPESKE